MKKILSLIISVGGTLAVGGLAAWLTGDNQNTYSMIETPALAPPGILFPIVWTVLYILMGISLYLINASECNNKENLTFLYVIQLMVNFIWPFIFFNWQADLISFIWLLLLWVLIIIMMIFFYRCRKIAGLLLIPYFLWVTFAGYLNLSIYLLNR